MKNDLIVKLVALLMETPYRHPHQQLVHRGLFADRPMVSQIKIKQHFSDVEALSPVLMGDT